MALRDDDTVRACPDCDSTKIAPVIDPDKADTTKDWRCDACRAKFDEPRVRERGSTPNGADAVLRRRFGVSREEAYRQAFGEAPP